MNDVDKKIGRRSQAHQRYKNREGKIVPGVTTVLGIINKPALVAWANGMGLQGVDTRTYVDQMASIGTLAHEMVQEDLGGPEWNRDFYSPEQVDLAENAFLKYLEWKRINEYDLETMLIEERMVSEEYQYGGTVDWYGVINGKYVLMDIKTSKALYPEHTFQVAAYSLLLQENGYPLDETMILRIGRDETEGFEVQKIDPLVLQEARSVYLNARSLYQVIKDFERRCKGN